MSELGDRVDRALGTVRMQVLGHRGLREELDASWSDFGGPSSELGPAERAARERRHAEWFLLERSSEILQGVPIEVLAHELAGAGALEAIDLEALRTSFCSAFSVTTVVSGEGAWLRDLLAGGEHPLADPEGSFALEEGDVLVGRLFRHGSVNSVSRAAAFFRSPALLNAFEIDLEGARARRRGVPRLSQSEVEAFLAQALQSHPREDTQDPLEEALRFLCDNGVSEAEAEEVLAELLLEPFDPECVLAGAGDALGRVLDRLAFQSGVDLARARELLLVAWRAASTSANVADSTLGASRAREGSHKSAARALADFDRGRAEGRALETLFRDLEADLGLESDATEDQQPSPDFPGAMGALVEEFLWEFGREHGEAQAKRFEGLRWLGEFGTEIGVIENLTARHLLLFACVWLPERRAVRDLESAQTLILALAAFSIWAEETQGLEVAASFASRLDELGAELPRVLVLTSSLPHREGGGLFELSTIQENGRVRLRGKQGECEVRIPIAVLSQVRPGDRLRGRLVAEQELELLCVYPALAAELIDAQG